MAGRKRAAGIAAAVGIAAGGGALTAGGPGATAAPSVSHGKALSSRGGTSTTGGSRRSGWVDRLAMRLDVSVTTLRSALQDVREATPTADRHADLISALAVGLGRSEAQVRTALEGGRTQRPRGRDALADALARELGLDAAKVGAAVDEVQDARRARGRLHGARGLGQALAEELGVDVDRLRDALRAVDGPKRARRGDAQGIATALNVDVAQVRAVLDAFRADEATRREARRDAFAAALAHELGMPVHQVSEALSAMPARRGHHR
jgi:hypothetical protein